MRGGLTSWVLQRKQPIQRHKDNEHTLLPSWDSSSEGDTILLQREWWTARNVFPNSRRRATRDGTEQPHSREIRRRLPLLLLLRSLSCHSRQRDEYHNGAMKFASTRLNSHNRRDGNTRWTETRGHKARIHSLYLQSHPDFLLQGTPRECDLDLRINTRCEDVAIGADKHEVLAGARDQSEVLWDGAGKDAVHSTSAQFGGWNCVS